MNSRGFPSSRGQILEVGSGPAGVFGACLSPETDCGGVAGRVPLGMLSSCIRQYRQNVWYEPLNGGVARRQAFQTPLTE